MSDKPNKKRVVIYIIIFFALALLIVFFSNRRSDVEMFDVQSSRGSLGSAMMEDVSYTEVNDEGYTYSKEVAVPIIEEDNINSEDITIPIVDQGGDAVIFDKKVIKTGSIDMRVNSVEQAINDIKMIAIAHGGDEMSSDISKNDTIKYGFITIKVPVNQYNEAFDQIKKIAPLVVSESSRAQDVTAQFMDLESRIKNKKEHEEQLRTFFEKAEDVSELIQIERELARVRTEIEQMEGRLKYLKDQTQYSTINVTLTEDASIVVSDSWRPVQVIKDSFNTLIHKTTGLINVVIRFVITSLPFILLFGIGAWFIYFATKHIFGKNEEEKKE